jgi:hypothetical protein
LRISIRHAAVVGQLTVKERARQAVPLRIPNLIYHTFDLIVPPLAQFFSEVRSGEVVYAGGGKVSCHESHLLIAVGGPLRCRANMEAQDDKFWMKWQ